MPWSRTREGSVEHERVRWRQTARGPGHLRGGGPGRVGGRLGEVLVPKTLSGSWAPGHMRPAEPGKRETQREGQCPDSSHPQVRVAGTFHPEERKLAQRMFLPRLPSTFSRWGWASRDVRCPADCTQPGQEASLPPSVWADLSKERRRCSWKRNDTVTEEITQHWM